MINRVDWNIVRCRRSILILQLTVDGYEHVAPVAAAVIVGHHVVGIAPPKCASETGARNIFKFMRECLRRLDGDERVVGVVEKIVGFLFGIVDFAPVLIAHDLRHHGVVVDISAAAVEALALGETLAREYAFI